MLKKSLFVVVPVLAALSPIAFFSAPDWWSSVTASLSPATSTGDPDGLAGFAPGDWPTGTSSDVIGDPQGSPEDARSQDLADVLQFDVTPDWVVSRWPRVSAGLAYLELHGYRVPLVTGTAEDDLAGALTYYFNPQQQLQRITFYGTTGNAHKLVDLVTSRFGFARRLTNDASMFVFEIPGPNGQPTSSLWVRPARVIKTDDPHRRFEVALVIERPGE